MQLNPIKVVLCFVGSALAANAARSEVPACFAEVDTVVR
jgi:hypothetical protein